MLLVKFLSRALILKFPSVSYCLLAIKNLEIETLFAQCEQVHKYGLLFFLQAGVIARKEDLFNRRLKAENFYAWECSEIESRIQSTTNGLHDFAEMFVVAFQEES